MKPSRILRPFLVVLSVALIFFVSFFILLFFMDGQEPAPAIDIAGPLADGKVYSLSESFNEKGTALVFFDLESRHSQEVMQRIIPAAKKQGVTVVAVCISELEIKESLAKMKELKIPSAEYTLFDIDGKMAKAYNVTAAPVTYFIDKNGMMLDAYLGTISEDSIANELKELS